MSIPTLSYYGCFQGIIGKCAQRIKRIYVNNESTERESQLRNGNYLKKSPMKFLELKTTTTNIKNSLNSVQQQI